MATCRLHGGCQLAILLGRHELAIGGTQNNPPITPLDVKVASGIPGARGGGRGSGEVVPPGRAGLGKHRQRTLTWWRRWTAHPRWSSASSTCPSGCGKRIFWCRGRSPVGRSLGRSLRPDWPTGPYLRREPPARTRDPCNPQFWLTLSPAPTPVQQGGGGDTKNPPHGSDPSASTSEGEPRILGRTSQGPKPARSTHTSLSLILQTSNSATNQMQEDTVEPMGRI